jgi:hypothetical protein
VVVLLCCAAHWGKGGYIQLNPVLAAAAAAGQPEVAGGGGGGGGGGALACGKETREDRAAAARFEVVEVGAQDDGAPVAGGGSFASMFGFT